MLRALTAYLYPIALGIISAFVMLLEALFPWRKGQKQLRRTFLSDLFHLAFNGHFLGVILYGISERYVIPHLPALRIPTAIAAAWPLALQIVVVIIVFDFIQWCVHNLLHRIPWLWELHKTHHSVVDGEMDWIVAFRFHWGEVVVYKAIQYLPLLVFGFRTEAILAHAIFGTLIGHLNHSNLDWGYGAWRYVLNSPRMHIWHHDYDAATNGTKNFAIIFSAWDWIFGTAKYPGVPPARIGFEGAETFPAHFFGQEAWPMVRKHRGPAMIFGAGLLALGWYAHVDRKSDVPQDTAISHFGEDAADTGFAHPEDLVSVVELSRAFGSARVALLDVRPADRFEQGHIPGAQLVVRDDFEAKAPIYGLTKSSVELEAMLRARGVKQGAIVVLYGDGAAEPYRLWWSLREVAGFSTRILDGGLEGWKKLGGKVVTGAAEKVEPGDVHLEARNAALTWKEIGPLLAKERGAVLIDARTKDEFTGKKKHEKADRAGRIPGSVHLEWSQLLAAPDDPRLKPPETLRAIFHTIGVEPTSKVVTSCMTGTRSSVTYFALWQLGMSAEQIANYNGSWSEYSRLDLPIETGTGTVSATP